MHRTNSHEHSGYRLRNSRLGRYRFRYSLALPIRPSRFIRHRRRSRGSSWSLTLARDNQRSRGFKRNASKQKQKDANASFLFLVGVTGFEPAASWSRTKRSTELSHTPIYFACSVVGFANEESAALRLRSSRSSISPRLRSAAVSDTVGAASLTYRTEPHPDLFCLRGATPRFSPKHCSTKRVSCQEDFVESFGFLKILRIFVAFFAKAGYNIPVIDLFRFSKGGCGPWASFGVGSRACRFLSSRRRFPFL